MCLKPFVTLHLSGSRSILAASMVAHEALANMPSTHSALCSDLFLHALPLQLHWPLAGILLPQGLSCPLPGMFCPLMAARLTPAQIIIFLMRPTMSSHSHHPNPPWVMQEKFLEPCYHWFLTTLILQPIRADPLPSREFQHSGFGLGSMNPSAYSQWLLQQNADHGICCPGISRNKHRRTFLKRDF